jgi:SAM-dependent methyltransferase
MTDQGARYDRIAEGYERWWAPVLRPSATALLDRLAPALAGPGTTVLDVGAGTGNLTIAALDRWPDLVVTAIDASEEMLATLGTAVAADRPSAVGRLTTQVADAAALPVPDASLDVVMSSFVLQLVPNRARVLREIRRVLRPGGTLGYVTWMVDRGAFAPDRVFDALLGESGSEDEPGDGACGDVRSAPGAAAELRRAGFRAASAGEGRLEYAFTIESYLGFLTEFDEASTFEDMTRRERQRFMATLRERLMRLTPDEFVFRSPIVYATGIRSDG